MAKNYRFSARLKEDTAAKMVVTSASYRIFRIISLVIFGALLTFIISSGLIDLAGGRGISWGMLIIVLVIFGLPIYSIVSTPLSHKIIINNVDNNLVLVVEYCLELDRVLVSRNINTGLVKYRLHAKPLFCSPLQ